MQTLNEIGFLRLPQIIGHKPKANAKRRREFIEPLVPVSASAWWAGIKDGRYPKGIKLSPRVTVWRMEDIKKLLERA